MVDNSLIQTAAGNETFANKDIGGIKHPKHITVDSTGLEVVPATHADMLTLLSKDFATQTTLASILAKLIASPATEATLASANSTLSSILSKLIAAPATEGTLLSASTTLTSILNKLIAAPATEASLVAGNTTLASILAKLIASPATESTLSAANTNLSQILSALQAQRAETIWTDDSGAYVVRVDKGGVITWVNLDGTSGTAPGTGARPVDADSMAMSRSSFKATANGTGFSTNDLIDHFVMTNPNTGTVVAHFWINLTTELKLASAPSAASITPISADSSVLGSVISGGKMLTMATIDPASQNLNGRKPATGSTPTVICDEDLAALQASKPVAPDISQIFNGTTSLVVKRAKYDVSASGTVVAAVTGKKIRVISWDLSPAAAVNVKWRSATTDITGTYTCGGAGNGQRANINPYGWFETNTAEALNINLSASVGVGGVVLYVEV